MKTDNKIRDLKLYVKIKALQKLIIEEGYENITPEFVKISTEHISKLTDEFKDETVDTFIQKVFNYDNIIIKNNSKKLVEIHTKLSELIKVLYIIIKRIDLHKDGFNDSLMKKHFDEYSILLNEVSNLIYN